jgi:hypothetical protein
VLTTKVSAGALAKIEREQEAPIPSVRLQDSKSAPIVSAVPGTMLNQAFSRLSVTSKRLPSWTAIVFWASAAWC